MREEPKVSELIAELQNVKAMLAEQNRVFTRRAEVDDERAGKLDKRLDEFEDRLNVHGKLQTATDTRWDAFVGENGIFRVFIRSQDEVCKKVDAILAHQNQTQGKSDQAKWIAGIFLTIAGMAGGFVTWLMEHGKR